MIEQLARVLEEAEAGQLPALIAEWSTADASRRAIAGALRVDLAVLVAHPGLVIPCLARRRERIARAGQRSSRGVLDAWTATWSHGKRWLRSCDLDLPPGIVEEYRTGIRGRLAVADAEGAGVIGVVGEHAAIAWDRGTGRRIDPHALRVSEPRWRPADRDPRREGRAELTDGHRTIKLAIGGDESATGVLPVDDHHALVTTRFFEDDDYTHVAYLVDLATGRSRWRIEDQILACAGRGDALVAIAPEVIALRDLTTGAVRGSWGCTDPGEVEVAPDGAIVTRSGSVIRVWDPVAAIAANEVRARRSESWIDAAFSPDGAYVLAGADLSATRDHAHVDALPLNGPGWLEGGPPRDCQRLANEAVLEITPYGFSAWRTRDGTRIVEDRNRRARYGDVVAFDPIGSLHAVWWRRGRRLAVFEVASGRPVFEVAGLADVERLGFSPDSAVLSWQHGSAISELDLATATVRDVPEARWEPPPREVTVVDGLLVLDGAAIPCDAACVVVASTGRAAVSRHEYYMFEWCV